MFFQFGQFAIELSYSGEFVDIGFHHWRVYNQSAKPERKDVTIHIQERPALNKPTIKDGWITDLRGGRWRAIYADKNRELFSIQYEASHHGNEIIVESDERRGPGIGIQYGMLLGLYKQCVGFHGVTLLCGDEIIILSAPSGTGKTTLAGLLEKYADAIVVNGDFALLSPTDEGIIFEPTPFCGSSGRCLNHRLRVNRIVFLKQSKENQWENLTAREAVIQIMNNSFIPDWDEEIRQTIQDNILKFIPAVKIHGFSFAPNKEAAELFFSQLKNQ